MYRPIYINERKMPHTLGNELTMIVSGRRNTYATAISNMTIKIMLKSRLFIFVTAVLLSFCSSRIVFAYNPSINALIWVNYNINQIKFQSKAIFSRSRRFKHKK